MANTLGLGLNPFLHFFRLVLVLSRYAGTGYSHFSCGGGELQRSIGEVCTLTCARGYEMTGSPGADMRRDVPNQ